VAGGQPIGWVGRICPVRHRRTRSDQAGAGGSGPRQRGLVLCWPGSYRCRGCRARVVVLTRCLRAVGVSWLVNLVEDVSEPVKALAPPVLVQLAPFLGDK
jgi:hypothetical protein